MRIVSPTPQPSRLRPPNRTICRTTSAGGTSAASSPCTALAMTRPRLWARPSWSRRRQCADRVGVTEGGLHPDLQVTHFDGTGRHIVGPQIEGAAAREIEAGVVPVAGQDAILNAAAVERKTHVRTAIVERKDTPLCRGRRGSDDAARARRAAPSSSAPQGCPHE